MKVSELEGAVLDMFVAKIEGYRMERPQDMQMVLEGTDKRILVGPQQGWLKEVQYSPSTDWAQGGALIEKYAIESWAEKLDKDRHPNQWMARALNAQVYADIGLGPTMIGPTPLIAACRALVASVYGEEVGDGD